MTNYSNVQGADPTSLLVTLELHAAWTAGDGVTGALTARMAPTKWDAVSRVSVSCSD